MGNFLAALYGTGAGSNDGDYSNPDFDAKIREADAADSPEEAAERFKEAQTILFKDLPAIPLWYSNGTAGYSENVDNVVFGWDSDRKSTRLNSSHVSISYAVFCLKK